MRSIRTQLLPGTALATAAVLLVSGVVIYALVSRTLTAEFDATLAAKARALASLVEHDDEGLEFEFAHTVLAEFEPSSTAAYYQVWSADGTGMVCSPSLCDRTLEYVNATSDAPVFRETPLPGDRPGRLVALRFTPRQEPDWVDPAPPMALTITVAAETVGLRTTLARAHTSPARGCLCRRGAIVGYRAGGCRAAWAAAAGSARARDSSGAGGLSDRAIRTWRQAGRIAADRRASQ